MSQPSRDREPANRSSATIPRQIQSSRAIDLSTASAIRLLPIASRLMRASHHFDNRLRLLESRVPTIRRKSPLTRPRSGNTRLKYMLLTLVLAATVGCMVGPNYSKPPAYTPNQWRDIADPQLKGVPADRDEWWTLFGDPTLDRLVRVAYQQNLALQKRRPPRARSPRQRGISVGNFFPQIQQGTGSYIGGRTSQNSPTSLGRTARFTDWTVAADATWELDVWGRFRRGIESSDANLYASVMNYDDVLVTLVSDVATAYINLRSFDERITLAQANVKIQQGALNLANSRFQAGGASALDVAQAQSVLESTLATIPQLELGRRQQENLLCILLGIPVQDLNQLIPPKGVIPGAPPEVAVGIPADLLRRRPDVRAAEAQAAAQSAQIGVAVSELLPHFTLTGTIGYEAADFGSLFRTQSLAANGGPGFNWAILNYGRIINNVRVQDARFEEAIANYQQVVLLAGQDADNSIATFIKSQQSAEHLSRSVIATRRAFDLSLDQYRAGGTSFLNVLNASATLVQEQDQLVQVQAAVANGLVSLERALGGGWGLRKGHEFIDKQTAYRMRPQQLGRHSQCQL